MKKISLIMLSFLMLGLTCGCSDSSVPQSASETTLSAETETTESGYTDSLPEIDFGGTVFSVWGNNARWSYFVDAEQDGDIINDAVYLRNAKISERFNVSFVYDLKTEDWKYQWSDERKSFEASVMAGDGAYDLVTGYTGHSVPDMINGYFLKLTGMKYLDFGQAWWMSGINKAMTVGGKQYFASGYYEMPTILRTDVVFFSTKLSEKYGFTNLYELVDSGEWTYEKMISMAGEVGSDLDGNGQQTQDDQFGLSSFFDHIGSTFTGTGYDTYSRDGDGYLTLTSPNQALFDANEMLYKLTYESPEFYFSGNRPGDNTDDTIIVNIFTENRSLFFLNFISYCSDSKFRAMGDYGILPIPKFDAEQKSYGTWSSPFSSAIPVDAKNPEMSQIILEALECESYLSVRPVYYNTALSNKYLNDEDSVRMLDIIYSNVRTDTSGIFGGSDSDYYLGLTMDFASRLAADESAMLDYVESINSAFRALDS